MHAYMYKYCGVWYIMFYIIVYLMNYFGIRVICIKMFNFEYIVNMHSKVWENLIHIIFNSS